MIIRDPRPEDMPELNRLIGELGYPLDDSEFRARFERVASAPTHHVFVAEEAGGIVGLLHVFERPALDKPCDAVVQALVVDNKVRGHGIGEALMRAAEAWAAERHLDSTSLYTSVKRERAHAFYERIGYQREGTSHLMRRS
ncbi:MAG TPA: GNAT family N-acetyltransferase [Reyranella sp.]|nr:GNAT family N-acetyltransferase [Reyranella sp.]